MGWEKRNKSIFYYRKIREGKKVRSVYFGQGKLPVTLDRHIKAHQDMLAQARAQRREEESLEEALNNLHSHVMAEAVKALEDAGYGMHKGQWHKTRKRNEN